MKRAKTAAAVLLALVLALTASADGTLPSLFAGDEGWYRDAVAPLIQRDGVAYVPAELFNSLDSVVFTEPVPGNLLFVNSADGSYISILFRDGSAAVNGEIVEGIGVFRNEISYYVEAEPVCGALGVVMEEWSGEDGAVTLRLASGETRFSMAELARLYTEGETSPRRNDPFDYRPEGDDKKHLYLLCTSPEDGAPYVASERLTSAGLDHTVFLWEDAEVEVILAGQAFGDYGVATEDADDTAGALVTAEKRIGRLTHRRTRLTIATGDPEVDEAIRQAGFCPITPDFTVTSSADLDAMAAALTARMATEDSITIFLTDCWKSDQMIGTLSWLLSVSDAWSAANLAD